MKEEHSHGSAKMNDAASKKLFRVSLMFTLTEFTSNPNNCLIFSEGETFDNPFPHNLLTFFKNFLTSLFAFLI